MKRITEDDGLTDAEKVRQIRGLLEASADRRAAIASLTEQVEADLQDTDYHAVLEDRSTRMQNRVSPILKALSWSGEPGAEPLLEAIDHFKRKDGVIDRNAPTGFLTAAERAAVLDGKFRVSLYKALLFLHVMGAIKAGTLNLDHSYKYRSLDDYLISRERWKQGREVLLERAGLAEFADPRVLLADLDTQLFEQYQWTNRRPPHRGEPARKRHARRLAPAPDAETRRPGTTSGAASVPREALHRAARRCSPPSIATATSSPGSSTGGSATTGLDPPRRTFFAGIAALGCDIGTGKILRISREINAAELENTVNWYFYPEGLHEVNDTLLRFMDRLELPQVYRRSPDRLHTSSDGQKFEVRADSLNANYSFKYFGKGKGVSVYSFIDERHLLFYSTVISAAERESAYVIDGLMHNDVVKSDIHSTDTHGYTEAIFGAMHLLGFSYAPRIKGLKRQRLSIFKGRKAADQTDWAVRPSGYIDTDIGASVQVPGSGIGAGAVVNLNLGALTDNVFSNVNGGPGVHTTTADSTVANASLSVLLGTVVSFSATAINQHAAITGDYGALAGSSVLTVTDLTLSILGTSIYSNFTGTIAANTSINLSTGLGSVSLLLNEQILSGDGISGRGVVSNAFHLNATALGLVNSDVIIGHAEAFETAGPSAVPEPASLALMGLGVLGAGLAGLRKRSAA